MMQTNSDEDVLAYTQQQATRVAQSDDPWAELMSAAFEAIRSETDVDGIADESVDSSVEPSISLPKQLGALALLAIGNAAKDRAESWLQERKSGSGDETAAEDYEVAPATETDDEAADAEETTDEDADESGSLLGKLFKFVVFAALIGAVAYAVKRKRGSEMTADEFDNEYGEEVEIEGNDE